MKAALAILISFFIAAATACEVPPVEQYTAADELISRTKTIALARVVKAELGSDKRNVEYSFEVITRLKGHAPENFNITGWSANGEGENIRYNEHADGQFWSNFGGRSSNAPDCEIHPAFVVGGTYLVFIEKPYHVKSFEIIQRYGGSASNRDKWLNYVQSKVAL